LVKLLNTYFSEMTAAIHARNGIIDKFVGDGLMAFWTAPFSRGESHATDACLAALAQQRAIRELREHLSDVLGLRRDLPEFSVRMGLATGDLVVGTIGSTEARSFTVIGDTVNLASRLEGANKAYETSILVDETTFQLAQNDVESREIDFLAVLGRLEPVRVYEIIAPAGCLSVAEQPCSPRGWRPIATGTGTSRSGVLLSVWRSCQRAGRLRCSSAHQAPARQDPPDGLGRGLAADRQVIRGA
jgi:adenylate cyclase